eukprot:968936_1
MKIRIVPLGAGQDVGRSCILVQLGGHTVMLDCGMHMGYNDRRRFPNFSFISKTGRFNEIVDCVIISHFPLDHCGALPLFTEMSGYSGPIYMTHPTKAICPILLEDMRKVMVERQGERYFFTQDMVKNCMNKVTTVNLRETVKVKDDLEITAFYAGHVLGAAMFLVRSGGESVLYTGDYNMTPDRHLGAASVPRCEPDVLITESTYATYIRDSKKTREETFLRRVHSCVREGGKVLIPVFSVGRSQELMILLESYWDRMNLKIPIYVTSGLTRFSNEYYKLFVNWTNQKIKNTFHERNMFDFKHIEQFDMSYATEDRPMVALASPGMLHAGASLEIFKLWAPHKKNMVILP